MKNDKFSLIFFTPAIKINFYIKYFKKYFSGRNIFIAREMTKKHETYYRDNIDKIVMFDIPLKGELTIVISLKLQRTYQQATIAKLKNKLKNT